MPPESATIALTVANRGTQVGTVISHTMMSPCWSLLASTSERTTFAVPWAMPGEAATPVMMSGSLLGSTGNSPSILSTTAMKNGSGLAGVGSPR